MDTNPIKVKPLGFDERSLGKLTEAFKDKSNGECISVQDDSADLILLNLDSSEIQNIYKELKSTKLSLPEVGVCKNNNDNWNITQVNFPIVISNLINTIKNEVNKKMDGIVNTITEDKIAAAMKAIDAKKVAGGLQQKRIDKTSSKISSNRVIPKKTDEMCFNAERFLLGHLLEAISESSKNKECAVLKCWSDKIILFDYNTKEIITDVNDNQIRNMAIAPFDDNLSSPIKVEYLDHLSTEYKDFLNMTGMRKISLEIFMWNLGSMTCRGRIPIEASVSERQYLIRWPNITRIKLGDNALRIISYWVKQPCSLVDIQQALDIPLQDVFTVYTAASSAGLASNARRNVDHIFEVPEVQDNNRRGLFSRIVKRLKNINAEAVS